MVYILNYYKGKASPDSYYIYNNNLHLKIYLYYLHLEYVKKITLENLILLIFCFLLLLHLIFLFLKVFLFFIQNYLS